MAMVSILIPSRNEVFLQKTVADLLANASGDIEIVVVLEGYWPDPPLPDDKRLKILHHGRAKGMRPAINAAAAIATGDFILKADAHTMWAPGYDEALQADYHEDNWIVVPRRHALEPESWSIDTTNPKYPVDYHYLSYPFERPGDETCGLHGTEWRARREACGGILLDDEMSSQGSAYFMSRAHWDRLGPMEIERYGNFIHEFQELGLKTWLSGGAVKINKRTWYAHLYKGRKYGRGYALGPGGHRQGSAWVTDYWMNDQWADRTRDLRWLVEKFAPVPGWPADLDTAFAEARKRLRAA